MLALGETMAATFVVGRMRYRIANLKTRKGRRTF
jgi:hypothetical protein